MGEAGYINATVGFVIGMAGVDLHFMKYLLVKLHKQVPPVILK